jgi:mannose-6-phosphate isomerase-like protein (cupin superfamily)
MKPQVLRAASSDEYLTEERCYILELSNSPSDSGLSIARARVEPGVTTALHRVIDTVERYIILSGSGQVEIEGLEACRVERYDVVIIPKGATQRITNTADSDLIFLAICTPRFDPECYEHLE